MDLLNAPFVKKKFLKPGFFTWEDFNKVLKKCQNSYLYKNYFVETIGPEGDKHLSWPLDNNTFIISNSRELWDFSFIKNKVKKYKWFAEYIKNDKWDVHIYGCRKGEGISFPRHNDKAHNFIVQCEGQCRWIVEGLGENILSPGDMLSIPYLCHHECIPLGKRLSVSLPFWKE
tara:strand:- start:44 stop:562 length:519 start_codon:yes stop_codon:yes gene_type:complete